MKNNITYEELHKILDYDLQTGLFRWKSSIATHIQIGQIAGSLRHGYLVIGIRGIVYLAHRLAWFYVHGYFPENNIDHIDRNPLNNKINNLREVSTICNIRNTGNFSHNTSGIKGVSFYKKTNKWKSKIVNNQKHYFLGYYDNFDDAVCARLAAEQCLDWSGCDSTSPAYLYVQSIISKSK